MVVIRSQQYTLFVSFHANCFELEFEATCAPSVDHVERFFGRGYPSLPAKSSIVSASKPLSSKGQNTVLFAFLKEIMRVEMKTFWKVSLYGLFCTMLLFVVVKSHVIDRKLEQIARPSRLFNLQMIESQLLHREDWGVAISPDHDRFFYVVSQQALHWMGKGSVSCLFGTADKKYVVKFIQVSNLQAPVSRGLFGKLFGRKSKKSKKAGQLDDVCASVRASFNELKEETGIVYVHLNRTKATIHGLKLIDSYGQSQRVCGDDTCFVVQEHATPMITTLAKLMEKGDLDQAKTRVDQIFSLLLSLAKKGYIDGEDGLVQNNNIGYTKDRAIYLDAFHFFHAKKLNIMERMRYECQLRLLPLERWLMGTYPELGSYYLQKRDEVLGSAALEKRARKSFS